MVKVIVTLTFKQLTSKSLRVIYKSLGGQGLGLMTDKRTDGLMLSKKYTPASSKGDIIKFFSLMLYVCLYMRKFKQWFINADRSGSPYP